MKTAHIIKSSYSGMMYSRDFQLWYTYLSRRLNQGWSTQDLSFLMGKPDHFYMDFEKMFQVSKFLSAESLLLDRVYFNSEVVPMAFHLEPYEVSTERIVRVKIEEDDVKWNYTIEIPWRFELGKKCSAAPLLYMEEWKAEKDLQLESDAMIHVRAKLDFLLDKKILERGKSSWELFQEVCTTGLSQLTIYPRHLKNCLYTMIQQGRVVVRNVENRYCFSSVH